MSQWKCVAVGVVCVLCLSCASNPNLAGHNQTQMRRLLAGQGRRVERIERIVPSLEDVFVSLIEAHDRAEAPLAEVKR